MKTISSDDALLPLHNWLESMNVRIVSDLQEKGWSVQKDYLGLGLKQSLRERLNQLEEIEALKRAGIGRNEDHMIASDIRKDWISWLDSQDLHDQIYLRLMEQLRLTLNKAFFLGLFEYEAHYAIYPEGGFYKKHIDALKGEKNRIISTVCYLNDEDWVEEDGGLLAIYDSVDQETLVGKILPESGSLVVFLSEDIPHEVTPARKKRYSIAGWFRCNSSSAMKVDPLI